MENLAFNPLTEFVVSYGDIVELGLETIHTDEYKDLILNHPGWRQYNSVYYIDENIKYVSEFINKHKLVCYCP